MLGAFLGTGDPGKNMPTLMELKLLLCLLILLCEFMQWQYDELLDRCHSRLSPT